MARAIALICLSIGAVAFLHSLVSYWELNLAAIDRYLIVVGAVWAGTQIGSNRVSGTRPSDRFVGVMFVLFAALAAPLAWFLQHAVTSGRAVLLWWQWMYLFAASAGVLLILSGRARTRSLLFPPLFLAFALPLPTFLLAPLQFQLQSFTTSFSEFALRAIGFEVVRPGGGFVLSLPKGDLGVAEACSGVRSLTALTALAAFVAYWLGFGPQRGIWLVILSIPIVVIVNVFRVVLSGVIQEYWGGEYIQGTWHEMLGFAMVLLGLGIIHRVALLIAPRTLSQPTASGDPGPEPAPVRHTGALTTATGLLVLTVFTSVLAAVWARTNTAPKFPPPDLNAIPMTLGDWKGRDIPVPDYIPEMLYQDAVLYREYKNQIGRSTFVWVLFWSAADQVRGYHHPDICLRNAGMTATSRSLTSIFPSQGGEIPLTTRQFSNDRGTMYVLYWTQEGQRVWGEADEQTAAAGIGVRGLTRRVAELFSSPSSNTVPGRIVVLMGTDHTDELARTEAHLLAKRIADEVYTLCPWASPPIPPVP